MDKDLLDYTQLNSRQVDYMEKVYRRSSFWKFVAKFYNELITTSTKMTGTFQLFGSRFEIPEVLMNKLQKDIQKNLVESATAVASYLKYGILILRIKPSTTKKRPTPEGVKMAAEIKTFLDNQSDNDMLSNPDILNGINMEKIKSTKRKVNRLEKDASDLFSQISSLNDDSDENIVTVIPLCDVFLFYKKEIETQKLSFRVFKRDFNRFGGVGDEMKDLVVLSSINIFNPQGDVVSDFNDTLDSVIMMETVDLAYVRSTQQKSAPDYVEEVEFHESKDEVDALRDVTLKQNYDAHQAVTMAKASVAIREREAFNIAQQESRKAAEQSAFGDAGHYNLVGISNKSIPAHLLVPPTPILSSRSTTLLPPGHHVKPINNSVNDPHNLVYMRQKIEEMSFGLGLNYKYITGDIGHANEKLVEVHMESIRRFSKPLSDMFTRAVNLIFKEAYIAELYLYAQIIEEYVKQNSGIVINQGLMNMFREQFTVDITFSPIGDKNKIDFDLLVKLRDQNVLSISRFKELALNALNLDGQLIFDKDTKVDLANEKEKMVNRAEINALEQEIMTPEEPAAPPVKKQKKKK